MRTSDPAPRTRTAAGQGLAEYALIVSLIAIVAIASLVFLGGTLQAMLAGIGLTL